MGRDSPTTTCPLRLLAEHADSIPQEQPTIEILDNFVRDYFLGKTSDTEALRERVFAHLTPFLLKLLGGYCHLSRGCGVNCLVRELLSTTYIEFDDLLNKFDFDRHLNFAGYIVKRLTWRIFNEFVKERNYLEHHVSVGLQVKDMTPNRWETEIKWLSAIEVQDLLSKLRPSRRLLILLHDWYGYSCSDIAAIQKLKPETIRKRISRARKKMLSYCEG